MDQLKTQLAAVKQHSFWVMAGGIVIWTLASWWISTGKLKADREAGIGAIKTAFEGVNGIRGAQPKHPNAATAAGMDEMITRYASDVQKGWQMQYDQQASVLVWPASFTEGFLAAVDKLRPIEQIPPPPTPIQFDLSTENRDEYANFIEPELPMLAKTIGTYWRASSLGATNLGGGDTSGLASGLAGAMPTPGAMPGAPTTLDASGNPVMVDDSITLWDPANQQEILMTHFGFVARDTTPATLEVLYAQEDLWVLQNIMDIIKATNGDATARHEAAIKQVDYVRIGRSAMGLAGNITPLGPVAAGMTAGMTATDGATPVAGAEGTTTGTTDGGTGMPGGEGMMMMMSRDPAEGRYVDEKYQPLPATRLRAALTSATPEDALLAVSKRMPVRIRLQVDQRKLNLLLAECGNSRLPVEVRQVRINREPAAVGAMGGSGGYAGGGYAPGGGGEGSSGYSTGFSAGFSSGFGSGSADSGGGYSSGFGGSGLSGYSPSMPGSSYGGDGGGYGAGMPGMTGARPGMTPGSHTQDSSVDLNIIHVELYGIVYIHNPVNKLQLQLDAPAAAPADGASADGTPVAEGTPADGTATPATTPAEGAPPAAVPAEGAAPATTPAEPAAPATTTTTSTPPAATPPATATAATP